MAKRKKKSKKTNHLVLLAILVLAFVFLVGFLSTPKAPEAPKPVEQVNIPTDPVFAKICASDANVEKNFYSCTDNTIGIKYVDRQTSAPTAYYDALGRKIQDCGGPGRPLAIDCLNLQAIGSVACTEKVSCP